MVEYIGVTMDETERVRANAAVHEAQAELARVARLTTMGELAASIAHEINQPLAAVVTNGNAALAMARPHALPIWRRRRSRSRPSSRRAIARSEVIGRIRALLKHRKPNTSSSTSMTPSGRSLALTVNALRSRAWRFRRSCRPIFRWHWATAFSCSRSS